MSSWLESCLVLVMLSATIEVKRVSIEPRPASVRPGMSEASTIFIQSMPLRSMHSFAKNGIGSPAGISPMVRAASNEHSMLMMVITISATSVAGIFLVRRGTHTISAMVPIPNSRAIILTLSAQALGKLSSMSSVLTGDFLPISGYICCSMMITPMPLIKPESTG